MVSFIYWFSVWGAFVCHGPFCASPLTGTLTRDWKGLDPCEANHLACPLVLVAVFHYRVSNRRRAVAKTALLCLFGTSLGLTPCVYLEHCIILQSHGTVKRQNTSTVLWAKVLQPRPCPGPEWLAEAKPVAGAGSLPEYICTNSSLLSLELWRKIGVGPVLGAGEPWRLEVSPAFTFWFIFPYLC